MPEGRETWVWYKRNKKCQIFYIVIYFNYGKLNVYSVLKDLTVEITFKAYGPNLKDTTNSLCHILKSNSSSTIAYTYLERAISSFKSDITNLR